MQRRDSITPGARIAPVGHSLRQRVQEPHDLRSGWSSGSASVVTISPSITHDPAAGVRISAFLPYQPRPARAATARSTTRPASTTTAKGSADATRRALNPSAAARRRSSSTNSTSQFWTELPRIGAVDLIKLNVWRNALVAEWERLSAQPNAGADEVLQRRLRRIEAEVE